MKTIFFCLCALLAAPLARAAMPVEHGIQVLVEYDSAPNPRLIFRVDGREIDSMRIDGLSYQPEETASALERRLNHLARQAFLHPTDRPAIRITTSTLNQIQPSVTIDSWIGSGTHTMDRAQQVFNLPPTDDGEVVAKQLRRLQPRVTSLFETQRHRALAIDPKLEPRAISAKN